MPIFAFGINYKTAPIEIREQAVFTPDTTPAALQDLINLEAVNEAMILSTCNRTEIYVDCLGTPHPPLRPNEGQKTFEVFSLLRQWLITQKGLAADFLDPHLYCREEQAAVQHIMRVASGLDSMVLGEPQILGQMKDAFALAQGTGSIGPKLGRLLPKVFAVTKQVRSDTAIGSNPVSLAYAALRLAKRIFTRTHHCHLLCIGSGDIAKLVALYLYEHGIKQIVLAGRCSDKTKDFAERIGAHCITLRDIPAYLPETDIIISATTSQVPILGKGTVESALKGRKRKPILMLDMALPRDIEAEISELEDVYLYNLDDLQEVVKQGYQCRQEAATQAEAIIQERANAFICELLAQDALTNLGRFRHHAETIAALALEKARAELAQGQTPERVLKSFAHNLINKLLHKPTLQLRQLAYSEQADLLHLLKSLYQHD